MLLTLKQVAERLAVSVGTVRDWERDGALPTFRLGKRSTGGRCVIRVRECDLLRFLRRGANAAAICAMKETPL